MDRIVRSTVQPEREGSRHGRFSSSSTLGGESRSTFLLSLRALLSASQLLCRSHQALLRPLDGRPVPLALLYPPILVTPTRRPTSQARLDVRQRAPRARARSASFQIGGSLLPGSASASRSEESPRWTIRRCVSALSPSSTAAPLSELTRPAQSCFRRYAMHSLERHGLSVYERLSSRSAVFVGRTRRLAGCWALRACLDRRPFRRRSAVHLGCAARARRASVARPHLSVSQWPRFSSLASLLLPPRHRRRRAAQPIHQAATLEPVAARSRAPAPCPAVAQPRRARPVPPSPR